MIQKSILTFILGILGMVASIAQTNSGIIIDKDIELIPLQDSIFIHKTFHIYKGFGRYPSNGLVIIRNGQAIMIDTPADNDKTERLTSFLRDSLDVEVTKLIIGHYHNDCLGGLSYIQSQGIPSVASTLTVDKCKALSLPIPSIAFTDSLYFDFNGTPISCRYFGAGHSSDNITVWMPREKVLFGGCLVKSANSKGLGNLSDAVVAEWDATIQNIITKYPSINTVIPGHGKHGGIELLNHTIDLVNIERKKETH